MLSHDYRISRNFRWMATAGEIPMSARFWVCRELGRETEILVEELAIWLSFLVSRRPMTWGFPDHAGGQHQPVSARC